MAFARNALLACGIVLLAAASPVGPAVTGAAAQSAIKVVVNGEPITSNEINQRARFLRLVARELSGAQLTKQATEELIDEKLKLLEAKRVKISASEAQVDQALANIAERVKLAPSQLGQALGQQGIDIGTLRQRLRGQIVWQQLVLNRFQKSVSISDSQIVAALEKEKAKAKPGDKDAVALQPGGTAAEYNLQQITFVITKDSAGGGQGRLRDAEAFRAKATGCDSLVQVARGFKDVVVKSIGKRTEDEIPAPFRPVLAATPVGKISKPVPTPQAVELLAVCDKRDIKADYLIRGKVEDDLREREGQLLARQYIGELRRIAVIDYK